MDDETPISILNDDCLLEIFQYLNLKDLANVCNVCQCFRAVAFRSFVVTHKYRIALPVDSEYEVTNDTTSPILKEFGQDVTDLRVSFPVNPEFNLNLEIYSDLRLSIISTIVELVGESLEKLCLENLQVFDFNTRTVNSLLAIFARIKVLKLSTFDRDATPCYLDFRTLCPAMMKLKLAGDFIIDAVKYPQLTNLTIQRNRLLDSDMAEEMLPQFYAANPQLRKLKIKEMNYSTALTDLKTANLHDLEKLSVECYNLPANDFVVLQQMPKLNKLRLSGIFASDNLEKTICILSQLKELKYLEMIMTERYNPTINENDLVRLARNLTNLESLLIDKAKITSNGLIAFIEHAPKLHHLNCVNTGLRIDAKLCRDIVSARQQCGVSSRSLQFTGECYAEDKNALKEVISFSFSPNTAFMTEC